MFTPSSRSRGFFAWALVAMAGLSPISRSDVLVYQMDFDGSTTTLYNDPTSTIPLSFVTLVGSMAGDPFEVEPGAMITVDSLGLITGSPYSTAFKPWRFSTKTETTKVVTALEDGVTWKTDTENGKLDTGDQKVFTPSSIKVTVTGKAKIGTDFEELLSSTSSAIWDGPVTIPFFGGPEFAGVSFIELSSGSIRSVNESLGPVDLSVIYTPLVAAGATCVPEASPAYLLFAGGSCAAILMAIQRVRCRSLQTKPATQPVLSTR